MRDHERDETVGRLEEKINSFDLFTDLITRELDLEQEET